MTWTSTTTAGPTIPMAVPMISIRAIREPAVAGSLIPIPTVMERLIATMNVHWIRKKLYLAYVVAVYLMLTQMVMELQTV